MNEKSKWLLCELEALKIKKELKTTLPDQYEAIVIYFNGQVYAYRNSCPHANARLDMNSERFFSFDKFHLFCSVHGALFHPETGYCLAGPCGGQSLEALSIVVEDSKVWYVQENNRSNPNK